MQNSRSPCFAEASTIVSWLKTSSPCSPIGIFLTPPSTCWPGASISCDPAPPYTSLASAATKPIDRKLPCTDAVTLNILPIVNVCSGLAFSVRAAYLFSVGVRVRTLLGGCTSIKTATSGCIRRGCWGTLLEDILKLPCTLDWRGACCSSISIASVLGIGVFVSQSALLLVSVPKSQLSDTISSNHDTPSSSILEYNWSSVGPAPLSYPPERRRGSHRIVIL